MRRVVVLGGGTAGFSAADVLAQALAARTGAELTLISDQPHYVVRPLLAEVATGWTPPQFALVELSELRYRGKLQVATETITAIDLERNEVRSDRTVYPYDYLLIAIGRSDYPPEEWSHDERVFSLANDIECARLRHKLKRLMGREDAADLQVAVIGGGATGVDFVATLADKNDVVRPNIVIYEAEERLLPRYPEEFARYAEQELEDMGVEVCLGEKATLDQQTLSTSQKSLEPDIVIWTGGGGPPALLSSLDTEHLEGNLVVDEFLRLKDRPYVFAAGSAAAPPGYIAGSGIGTAAEMGRTAARNLLAAMSGRAPEAMMSDTNYQAVSVGQRRAIANPFGVSVSGRTAWGLYRMSLARAVPNLVTRLEIVGSWMQQWMADAVLRASSRS